MLSGLLDVIVKPLEDYVASVATTHAEKVGEQIIRTMVTREVKDYVIPRIAVAAGLIVTSTAVNIFAFTARNRRTRSPITTRQVLADFHSPMPRSERKRRLPRRRR